MRKVAAVALLAVVAGCSATTGLPGHTSSSTGVTSRVPTGAPVTAGPLGGSWCADAWWHTAGSGIVVQVNATGPDIVSVQVVDAADTPIGSGTGRIDAGASGANVRIPVAEKIGGVSLGISGAEAGVCAVPQH